jgi:hypothetical protein
MDTATVFRVNTCLSHIHVHFKCTCVCIFMGLRNGYFVHARRAGSFVVGKNSHSNIHSAVCFKTGPYPFQSVLCTACDLVLPLSISTIFSFP